MVRQEVEVEAGGDALDRRHHLFDGKIDGTYFELLEDRGRVTGEGVLGRLGRFPAEVQADHHVVGGSLLGDRHPGRPRVAAHRNLPVLCEMLVVGAYLETSDLLLAFLAVVELGDRVDASDQPVRDGRCATGLDDAVAKLWVADPAQTLRAYLGRGHNRGGELRCR